MTPGSESRRAATKEEILKIRYWHGMSAADDVQVDEDADVVDVDEGIWVQGWLWLPNEAR